MEKHLSPLAVLNKNMNSWHGNGCTQCAYDGSRLGAGPAVASSLSSTFPRTRHMDTSVRHR